MTRTDEELVAHFWNRVNIGEPDQCWPWTGPTDNFGYGMLHVRGRSMRAHRYSYQLTTGPLTPGVIIRHRCDNPPCANPSHLEPGTRADNNRDRDSRGRQVALRGEAHGNSKLTTVQVASIRAEAAAGERKVTLAERYGISEGHVYQIIKGRCWSQ